MNREELYAYLMDKLGASQEIPFGPDTIVFKVLGKMFALIPADEPLRVNLKCDPDEALFLRDIYSAVRPGYHMNKRHWNTVSLDGTIPDGTLRQMVDDSYELVVKGLSKAQSESLTFRRQ